MKFAFSAILAASLTASSVVAAKPRGEEDQRKLEEMHAAAFGAVVIEHSASDWKKFLSEGPVPPLVQVDPLAGGAKQKKPAKTDSKRKTAGRELWWEPGYKQITWPKVGYHAIDTKGGSMEVKRKKVEQCFYMDEGIGRDGWRFGITQGPVGNMTGTFDTFLQLFDEDWPVTPVYKAFKGARQLCIGEKEGNIAYLYIVYGDGCYWLIGSPNAGSDSHLPKLKVLDNRRRKLWSSGAETIVRFRDGPGYLNSLWEIYSNGMSQTAPDAKWYFIPESDDDSNLIPNDNFLQ